MKSHNLYILSVVSPLAAMILNASNIQMFAAIPQVIPNLENLPQPSSGKNIPRSPLARHSFQTTFSLHVAMGLEIAQWYFLLFQKTIQFSSQQPAWRLTTNCNPNSRGPMTPLFLQVHAHPSPTHKRSTYLSGHRHINTSKSLNSVFAHSEEAGRHQLFGEGHNSLE